MAERRSRPSLRRRITGAATAVVGGALVLGAVGFGLVLRSELLEQASVSVEADAEELANRVEASGVPDELDEVDDGFAQILSERGDLLVASEDAEGIGRQLPPGPSEVWQLRLPGEDAGYIAATEDADEVTVVVGRSLESVDDALGAVVGLLLVAVPLVISVVAATTWLVVGRALRPVDRMRREVDEVSGTSLDRRVADPGGADELSRLASTMNSMLGRLEHAQQAQRRFISDASHELKSPLASLRQYAEVQAAHPDRVSAAELSEAMLDEGARLERLVGGMLLLARADEDSLAAAHSPVDLDDIVLREARRLRDHGGVTVDTVEVGALRVLGDEGLLAQAIRNLVDNAARHATSRVSLTLTGAGLFAVDDDGTGVPASERDRIFERFVRLDDARGRDAGGSGLGLAITRELVTAHGGSVVVTDSALGGARFEVRLEPVPAT